MSRLFVKCACLAVLAGLLVLGAGRLSAHEDRDGDADDGASRNMKLVGFNDLQARSTYQPTLHKQGGRYYIYAGHHAYAGPGEGQAPAGTPPLPKVDNQENGTSIVDVTNPRRPKYVIHIPVPNGTGGGAQMVRVCDGIGRNSGRVFMLRSYGNTAHEIWDVSNPAAPFGVRTVAGGNAVIGAGPGQPGALAGTHKSWWECDTGIAYVVGRRGNDTAAGWKAGNHIFVFDLSNPSNPVFLRDWALDGQQPGGVTPPHFTNVPSIHGPISTGPAGGAIAAAGATADRVYFAYGTGSAGVMQIVDRTSLLSGRCGSAASSLDAPSCATADFKTAELGRWIMNPDNGAHTSFPIGKIPIQDFTVAPETGNPDLGTPRDIVFVTSEATANFCAGQVRHLSFTVDATDEGRPQSIATYQVSEASGRFCARGGRFGPHATNEEFGAPFYQKLVFTSQFNAGVRVTDVRNPYNPREVGFFIPAVNANTDLRCAPFRGNPSVCVPAVQTNNVATDDRGFVYIVDRADSGMHVLQLTGEAARIAGLSGDDD
jgi:hypothetical protein